MYDNLKCKTLFNLDETIAKDIFNDVTFPWEVLPKIKDFIIELGKTLSLEEYSHPQEDIWIAKSATVAPMHRSMDHVSSGKDGSTSGCFYPWQCDCGRILCCRKFNRIKKCYFI